MNSFRPTYTVSQLTSEIKKLLERGFEFLWVEGEISNLRLPSSGHLYFTLKDETAQIRGVMFRLQNRILPFDPIDGLQVLCYGRLSVYEPRGEYQIIADYMEPKGRGALQFAFEQLKEKLSQEGLFDPLHKKPLPHLPRKIGIVTSPTGAAIRDILQIIDRRFANVAILLYPVRVQGPGAAQEIAQAVTELSRWPQIDVLIVGRGGGSLEDLWAFNEEVVARAIFHSPIPIISAVGHEIDFTIADFVADLRAPTPSAAAELVVRNKVELVQSLVECEFRLTHAGRTFAQTKRERLASLLHRLSDPRKKVFDQRMRLDDFSFRLRNTFSHLLSQKAGLLKLKLEALFLLHPRRKMTEFSQGLSQLLRRLILAQRSGLTLLRQKTRGCGEKLHTLSPLAILERGYSIVRILPSREIVRQTSQIRVEDRVQVRVHQGEFVAKVEGVQEKQEDEPPSLTLGSGGV